jgi:uncharacterized protein YjdB
MPFTHKLAMRLALLKDRTRVVGATVWAVVTRRRSQGLRSDLQAHSRRHPTPLAGARLARALRFGRLAPIGVCLALGLAGCDKLLSLLGPGQVVTVVLTPSTLQLYVGTSQQLAADPEDANGRSVSGMSVAWSTGNPALATVDGNGKVTGVGVGQVTITAAAGGKTGSASVAVAPVPVKTVAVTPAAATVQAGLTVQLTATPKDSTGAPLTGRVVTWGSNNTALATVSATGLVTAVAPGAATITATSEGKGGSATVTVSAIPVASVSVTPPTASIAQGATVQLTGTPLDASNTPLPGRVITWTSSNTGVATVDANGLVTGVGAGSGTITAVSEGKSGTATITVTAVPVASVSVTPATASVAQGTTVQLTATPKDASGNPLSGRVVTWASGNTAIATVSSSGLVTGVGAGGPVTITATSEGQSGSASVTVTAVTPVASVTVSPANGSVQAGSTYQLTATPKDASGNPLTGRVVTWSSANTAIATVSSSGLVTGVAAGGPVTITATSEGKSGTAAITVTVPPPPAACGAVSPGVCWYVDGTAGNDASAGDSAHPFQTITHAAGIVNPGDVVIVRNGVYGGGSSNAVLDIGRGGTATAWVTFKAEHKWGAAIDGGGSPGVQAPTDAGVHFSASYVRVEGFEIRWVWHDGVDMGVDNIALAGNNIHDIGRYCESGALGISAIAAYANNLLVEQNWIHDIGRLSPGEYGCSPTTDYWQNHDHGIYLSNGNNILIRNNVFFNINHGWDVHRYGSTCDQVWIVNNTFAFPNPNRDGQIILASTTTNLFIQNNIFYQPGLNIGISGTEATAVISNNISTGAIGGGGTGTNLINTDPLLVNPTGLDFHLQAGSPAIGVGVALSNVTNDFAGKSRLGVLYDIGAYQH